MEFTGYWACPCCGWLVADCEYVLIKFDPDCAGCGAKKWSEFQYQKTMTHSGVDNPFGFM